MKVYFVYCSTHDFIDDTADEILLGVYSTIEKAINARLGYFEAEIEDCTKDGLPYLASVDRCGNPYISRLADKYLVAKDVYKIKECHVA